METEARESSEVSPQPGPEEEKKKRGRTLRGLPVLVLVSLLMALLLKTFLVQAFFIPSGSMVPTLETGDRVLVNKVVYHLRDIHRGDVIVFRDPTPEDASNRNAIEAFLHWLTEGLGFTQPEDEDFIKRVIGLPGETLQARGGVVYVNGEPIDEPYLAPSTRTEDFGPVAVPADSMFMMGDNRGSSIDSRGSLGFVPMDKVVGEAFVIMWPPSRLGLIH
ncbi:MAG: signal peptidase I [Actinomycetota bacterium]